MRVALSSCTARHAHGARATRRGVTAIGATDGASWCRGGWSRHQVGASRWHRLPALRAGRPRGASGVSPPTPRAPPARRCSRRCPSVAHGSRGSKPPLLHQRARCRARALPPRTRRKDGAQRRWVASASATGGATSLCGKGATGRRVCQSMPILYLPLSLTMAATAVPPNLM